MAVRVRLSRSGKKHQPYWRIVAVDSRRKRDGGYLEYLGTYNPLRHEVLQLKQENIDAWVAKGAILSDPVIKIIKMAARANTTQTPA